MSTIIDIRSKFGPVALLTSDEEASEAARNLLNAPRLDGLLRSGLLGISVPAALGGADVSNATLSQIMADLAAANPEAGMSLAHHAAILEAIRAQARPEQAQHFLARALSGCLFATLDQGELSTLVADGPGYVLTGLEGSRHQGCLALAVRMPDGSRALCLLDGPLAPEGRDSGSGLARSIGIDRIIPVTDIPPSRIARATARLFVSSAHLGAARNLHAERFGSGLENTGDDRLVSRFEVECAAAAALLEQAGRLADMAQVGSALAPADRVERAERVASCKVSDALGLARQSVRQDRQSGEMRKGIHPAIFTLETHVQPARTQLCGLLW